MFHKLARDRTRLLALMAFACMLATLACGQTPLPRPTTAPTATSAPTNTLSPTDTPAPTPTLRPTSTLRPTEESQPTATSPPTETLPQPTPTDTAMPASLPTRTPAPASPTTPPSSGVVSTFLADARQTQEDLVTIKVWFDRLAGGERIPCSTVYAHSIHRPSSTAPGTVPDLAATWNEYQSAIADGQTCLQWLIDFCDQGGGVIDEGTFWNRRDLSSSALSHCEHVVQALEAMQ